MPHSFPWLNLFSRYGLLLIRLLCLKLLLFSSAHDFRFISLRLNQRACSNISCILLVYKLKYVLYLTAFCLK